MTFDIHTLIEVVGSVVTVASAFANFIPAGTIVGKLCHLIALNGPRVLSAAASVDKPPAAK